MEENKTGEGTHYGGEVHPLPILPETGRGPKSAVFRFYEELNDFLPERLRKRDFVYHFSGTRLLKDAIESLGVPHPEVELIVSAGEAVPIMRKLEENGRFAVYPVFESFDLTSVETVHPLPLREPLFLADVHLGKLARYLRLLGFDTLYNNRWEDDEIAGLAEKEKRIVLTRDLGLLKRARIKRGYWPRSSSPKKQTREIIKHFQLEPLIDTFKRCTVCNGIIEATSKEEIEQVLKPEIRNLYETFFRCRSCGRIYWKGSHWEGMNRTIKEFLE